MQYIAVTQFNAMFYPPSTHGKYDGNNADSILFSHFLVARISGSINRAVCRVKVKRLLIVSTW